MAFKTTQVVWDEMLKWAADHPTIEVTGFIAGVRGLPITQRVVPMKNVHPCPEQNYAWEPKDAHEQLGSLAQHEELLAIYHSHPTGKVEPSTADVHSALWVGAYYLILTPEGAASAWWCEEMRSLVREEVELL